MATKLEEIGVLGSGKPLKIKEKYILCICPVKGNSYHNILWTNGKWCVTIIIPKDGFKSQNGKKSFTGIGKNPVFYEQCGKNA